MVRFCAVLTFAAGLGATMAASGPAAALTSLRSPAQLAQDETLIARASSSIAAAATSCFLAPVARGRRSVTVRFFLAGGGKQVSQLQVIGNRATPPAVRRAAFTAIRRCAPYALPEELRSWGGFWATVTFR